MDEGVGEGHQREGKVRENDGGSQDDFPSSPSSSKSKDTGFLLSKCPDTVAPTGYPTLVGTLSLWCPLLLPLLSSTIYTLFERGRKVGRCNKDFSRFDLRHLRGRRGTRVGKTIWREGKL